MRALPPVEHAVPDTLEDALERVAEGALPYAGATELIPAMRMGLLRPDRIVDLKKVRELSGVEVGQERIRIGATTRHAELSTHPELTAGLPVLSLAAGQVGNPRVRWQGTLGGNLAFAEPRSDLVPVLISLHAMVRLVSQDGYRDAPLHSLVLGPYAFERSEGELLAHVSIDRGPLLFQGYERIQVMERPSVGVALVGTESEWRLAVGAACHTPVWFDIEHPEVLDANRVAQSIDPLEDSSGSADYKRHLVALLTRRLIAHALSEMS